MDNDIKSNSSVEPANSNNLITPDNQSIPLNHKYDIPHKKSNFKKALLYILIPLFILIISFIAMTINSREPDTVPVYSNGQDIGLVSSAPQQSIIPPQILLIISLITPLLLLLMAYGFILLVKKPSHAHTIVTDGSQKPPGKPSFKMSVISFIAGILLILIAMIVVRKISSDVGYSGSESEIGAIPFILSGYILIFISLISFIITVIKRYIFVKKYNDKNPQI